MTPQVVPVAPDQWQPAGDVLARALQDSPMFSALVPDTSARAAFMQAYGRWQVRTQRLGGGVVETTPGLGAVAVWVPPAARRPWWLALRVAPQLVDLVRTLPLSQIRRVLTYFRAEDQRIDELVPEPYWFLVILGVEPAKQRFGLGAVLVRHGLARADRDRTPVYVVTDTEDNARFYGKLGFEVVEYVSAEDDPFGVQTWRMVRPARREGAAVPRWTPRPWMNSAMSTALRTPGLQRVLGSTIALITVTGRRSGNRYTTPVTYFRDGDTVTVVTKRFRTWWRNLDTNPQVGLRLAGTQYRGHAKARVGDDDTLGAFCEFLAHRRQDAKAYGIEVGTDGVVDTEQARAILPELVIVTIELR